MGVYKELAHEIESLIKRQKQIYPDACDFGVPVKHMDANYVAIHKVILEARESFKTTRKVTKYGTGLNVVTTFVIPWEKDGNEYCGTKYSFDYCQTNSKFKDTRNYVTITQERVRQKESPFLKD